VSVTQQQVLDALAKVASPRGVALTNANVLSAITASDGKVFFSINVDAAEARAWESVRAQAEAAVRAIPGVGVAMIALTAERKPGAAPSPSPAAAAPPPAPHQHRHAHGVQPVSAHKPPQSPASPMSRQSEIPGIAAVIAVASGKGGVGKSTTALNLALGLRDLGMRVGLLDADIYGPSVPRLTGIHEKPKLNDDRKMIPIERFRSLHHVDRLPGRGRNRDDLARADGDVGDHPRCCATWPGARSIFSWSTCRPAPATHSSPWRRTCR